MNCPDCGATVEKTDRFCPKCYARIEPPSLWRRLLSFLQNVSKPGAHVVNIKKTATIKTVDKDGKRHEYHSLAEVPPELQKTIQVLEAEAMKEGLNASTELTEQNSTEQQKRFLIRKNVSIYRIKDAHGKEQVYHSLDEMPPEIRAKIEKAQRQAGKL